MAFHFAFEVPELNKYASIAYIYLSICTLYRYAHVTYISLFYSHSYSHSNHSSKTNSQTDTDKGTVTRRYRENVAIALMCRVCAQSVALLCSRPAKGAYDYLSTATATATAAKTVKNLVRNRSIWPINHSFAALLQAMLMGIRLS